MRFLRTLVASAVCISGALQANAEPSGVVSQLMRRPVSAFDFGLQQLSAALEHGFIAELQKIDNSISSVIPIYRWETNKIEIMIFSTQEKDPRLMRTNCEDILDIARKYGQDPRYEITKRNHLFSNYFYGEYNFKENEIAEMKELDKVFEIVYYSGQKRCVADLVGSGYSMYEK